MNKIWRTGLVLALLVTACKKDSMDPLEIDTGDPVNVTVSLDTKEYTLASKVGSDGFPHILPDNIIVNGVTLSTNGSATLTLDPGPHLIEGDTGNLGDDLSTSLPFSVSESITVYGEDLDVPLTAESEHAFLSVDANGLTGVTVDGTELTKLSSKVVEGETIDVFYTYLKPGTKSVVFTNDGVSVTRDITIVNKETHYHFTTSNTDDLVSTVEIAIQVGEWDVVSENISLNDEAVRKVFRGTDIADEPIEILRIGLAMLEQGIGISDVNSSTITALIEANGGLPSTSGRTAVEDITVYTVPKLISPEFFASRQLNGIDAVNAASDLGVSITGTGIKVYQLQFHQDAYDVSEEAENELIRLAVKYGDVTIQFIQWDGTVTEVTTINEDGLFAGTGVVPTEFDDANVHTFDLEDAGDRVNVGGGDWILPQVEYEIGVGSGYLPGSDNKVGKWKIRRPGAGSGGSKSFTE